MARVMRSRYSRWRNWYVAIKAGTFIVWIIAQQREDANG